MTQPTVSQDKFRPELEREAVRSALNRIILNGSLGGSTSGAYTVTLGTGSTTTTVLNPNFGKGQIVVFEPTTANAAKELHGGTMYVSAQTNGSFTITHNNLTQSDRTFRYVFLG